jgi:hypothetical protein
VIVTPDLLDLPVVQSYEMNGHGLQERVFPAKAKPDSLEGDNQETGDAFLTSVLLL